MLAALAALVVVCLLSAATAIIALSFTNRAGRLLQQAGDDLAMIDGLRLTLARLALGLAIQHALPGGDVAMTARPSPQGARFAISGGTSSMPHEDAASSLEQSSGHYFDQYTMELHVSKRLVEAHGGRLGVDGDALWLSLPSEPVLLRDPDSHRSPHANVTS
jgi:hypothetical protein